MISISLYYKKLIWLLSSQHMPSLPRDKLQQTDILGKYYYGHFWNIQRLYRTTKISSRPPKTPIQQPISTRLRTKQKVSQPGEI